MIGFRERSGICIGIENIENVQKEYPEATKGFGKGINWQVRRRLRPRIFEILIFWQKMRENN